MNPRITALGVLALSTLSTGCFRTSHWPTCEELDRTAVADDEETPAGTAADLRARVVVDASLLAVFADDSAGEVDVLVVDDGAAEWVEQERSTATNRSFGFGSFTPAILVLCPNHLSLPVSAAVSTSDGSIDVLAVGSAIVDDPNDAGFRDVPAVYLDGAFADSTFPHGEHQPADWSDKYSFINLDYNDVGLVSGTAGWGGSQENSSMAEYVVDFTGDAALDELATTPQ